MINLTPSQLDALIDGASPLAQEVIFSDEINKTTAILGKVYKLPISLYISFKNIIMLTLLGAIMPSDVVQTLTDELSLSSEDAYKLAQDLEKSVFEKARIVLLGKPNNELVTLQFEGEGDKDELRKKILDTTKRDSGFATNQSSGILEKRKTVITPGSRSQLLEQLQVLDSIPDDDEVTARLQHIQEQIKALEAQQHIATGAPEVTPENDALIFQNNGDNAVPAVPKAASYSKAPTKYNIDPYREVSGV